MARYKKETEEEQIKDISAPSTESTEGTQETIDGTPEIVEEKKIEIADTKNLDYRIEIRLIPDRNGIRKFSENLEHYSQAHTIGPLVDPISRKYITGLTDHDIEYLRSLGCSYNLDDNYVHGIAHEFWEAQYVKTSLIPTPMFLYPYRNILDYIKWKYLLKSKFVYVSESEMMEGSKPEATHIIFDESHEHAAKANKIERRNTLARKLTTLSPEKKKQVLTAITNEYLDKKSENYITVRFSEFMDIPERVEEILEIIENTTDSELKIISYLTTGISKGILKRRPGGIFYFDTNLGLNTKDAKNRLMKPENVDLLSVIIEKIDAK